jgi:aspartate racemase
MKTIGVLGGLGPQATMDFVQRLHQVSQRFLPHDANSGYPPMVVTYFREPPVVMAEDGRPASPVQVNPAQLLAEAAVRFSIAR